MRKIKASSRVSFPAGALSFVGDGRQTPRDIRTATLCADYSCEKPDAVIYWLISLLYDLRSGQYASSPPWPPLDLQLGKVWVLCSGSKVTGERLKKKERRKKEKNSKTGTFVSVVQLLSCADGSIFGRAAPRSGWPMLKKSPRGGEGRFQKSILCCYFPSQLETLKPGPARRQGRGGERG